jgi:hypothetical protein
VYGYDHCNKLKSMDECIGSVVYVEGAINPEPFVEAETAIPVLTDDGSVVGLYGKHTLIIEGGSTIRLYMSETINCQGPVEVTGRYSRESCPEGVMCDARAKIVVDQWACIEASSQ